MHPSALLRKVTSYEPEIKVNNGRAGVKGLCHRDFADFLCLNDKFALKKIIRFNAVNYTIISMVSINLNVTFGFKELLKIAVLDPLTK